VTIIPTPEFSLGGPYIACEPETLVVAVTPGNFNEGDATYAWSFGGAPVGNTSSIVPTEFGAYTVTVTVGDCSTEQSVTVTENTAEVAVMVDDYCEDGVYMLEAMPVEFEGVDSFNPDTATYEWTGTNFMGDTRVVTVPTEGVYTVTVTTADGCVGEATYEVSSIACTIQRGISPNGDEYNQYFDLETLDVAQLSIFNRYGQEVYTKSNYTNEWHGQANNGDELPTGTYFYMIERSNGEQITGWIYVNREE
jgi:gliding motility-associated-like protein